MTGQELDYVRSCITNEGFDYCFHSYSNFTGEAGGEGKESEVKDPEFHRLRLAYLAAREELAKYLGLNI